MNISFSTISPETAKRFLAHPSFDWLNAAAKEVALKYLGEDKLRVQDPEMYAHPRLEISTESIRDEVLEAMNK